MSNECFCTVYYCVLYSPVFKRQYPSKQIKVISTGHTVKVPVRYFTPTGRVLAHKSIRIEVGRSPATSGGHFCHESGPPFCLSCYLFVFCSSSCSCHVALRWILPVCTSDRKGDTGAQIKRLTCVKKKVETRERVKCVVFLSLDSDFMERPFPAKLSPPRQRNIA